MNINTMSDSCHSMSTLTFPILDTFKVTVEATHNPLQLPLNCLFSMAARLNKKRSFLFVSKLLGKHIAVNPYTSLLSGAALAVLLYEQRAGEDERIPEWKKHIVQGLSEPSYARQAYEYLMSANLVLTEQISFVGFAETATALGHSMYGAFADQATYIHSTREQLSDITPDIQFEEEHSHATAHRCYALEREALEGSTPLVLVDDEITTGNTTLNIIRDIQRNFPRKQYYIASLLDWRTEENEHRFEALEAELGIVITPLSLLKGRIHIQGEPILETSVKDQELRPTVQLNSWYVADHLEALYVESSDAQGRRCSSPYLRYSGRFGLHSSHNASLSAGISKMASTLRNGRTGKRTLVMGTGEFMYIPMRIAAEMGEGVHYQSTTRSPIYTVDRPGYAVVAGYDYASPEDLSVTHYIYNVQPGQYDEIFVLLERRWPEESMQSMMDVLSRLGCNQIHVVYCGAPE